MTNKTADIPAEESMDEILSSIRRILSDETPAGKKHPPVSAKAESKRVQEEKNVVGKTSKSKPFVLTPAMRVDQPTGISEIVIRQIDLTELDVTDKELRPAVRAWLNANLPNIVEKVVRDEVVRVLTRIK